MKMKIKMTNYSILDRREGKYKCRSIGKNPTFPCIKSVYVHMVWSTICLALWATPLWGQAVMGAREVGLGQAVTALPNSRWAMFGNPALLKQDRSTVSFFGIRYYGFAELTDVAAAAALPLRIGTIAGGVYRYGDDLFEESRLRVGYKNAVEGFHFGLIISYNHVSIEGYGSAGALGIDAGIAAKITEELELGAKATNLNQPAYGDSEEELPRDLSIGLTYRLSDVALLSTDLVKDVRFPLSWRGGIEVSIIDNLQGRAGVTTNPQTFSLGFGYNTEIWGVNVVVQRHENPVLGLSPGFDLNLSW